MVGAQVLVPAPPVVPAPGARVSSTRNIGILAHVDAGKTTITERILFATGAVRSVGSVDRGDSKTDTLDVERRRGISVRLATVSVAWKDARLNLLDTPGHVDFSGEVERGLRALDGAVLVLSAVEGVQAHTETLWQALEAQGIPRLILINKLDRIGADALAVVDEIRATLNQDVVLLQQPLGQGERGADLEPRWGPDHQHAELVERIVETDEDLLERYLEEELIDFGLLDAALQRASHAAELTPVLLAVAKEGTGIPALLDAMVRYLPAPAGRSDAPLSGVVYQVHHTARWGRLAAVRLSSGSLGVRDEVPNATRQTVEKVNLIKRYHGCRLEDSAKLEPGDVALVAGLSSARVGDVLGDAMGIAPPSFERGRFVLTGRMPARVALDYPIKLSSRSGGKGKSRTWMHSYQPCEPGQGETRDYLGISPLDRAKYILHARKAL